jgi:3D (Asp-Asp-Asp) domain-containing protein
MIKFLCYHFSMKIKTLILALLLACNLCHAQTYMARVTYYWDGYQTSTGAKPTVNKTIAVDPKVIPYKSKIFIPKMGKTFLAQDTGKDVRSRRASRKLGRSNIVVDIYCKNKKEALIYIKKFPMFMEIEVMK